MTYSDFEFICKDKINDFYKELKVFDELKCQGKAIHLDQWRLRRVYYCYEKFHKEIRKQYMSRDRNPMDRHKIAANFMCSLLKAYVIRVNRLIPDLPIELYIENEGTDFYIQNTCKALFYTKRYGIKDVFAMPIFSFGWKNTRMLKWE